MALEKSGWRWGGAKSQISHDNLNKTDVCKDDFNVVIYIIVGVMIQTNLRIITYKYLIPHIRTKKSRCGRLPTNQGIHIYIYIYAHIFCVNIFTLICFKNSVYITVH